MAVDYIIKTSALFTADELVPRPGAVAVSGEEIVSVGSAEEILSLAGADTQVIDAGDKLVMPGFNDSHMHFSLGSVQTDEDFCVDLLFLPSEQACLDAVKKFADEHPDNPIIYGCGWCAQAWEDQHDPDKRSLDALGINRPICLSDFSMHMAWVNSAALKLGGITAETPDPEGGVIRRFENGEPSGLLCEPPATNRILDIVLNVPDFKGSLLKSMRRLNAMGVTAVGDMHPLGVTCPNVYGTYQELADADESTVRISFYPALDKLAAGRRERELHAGDRVRCAGLKLIMDGCVEAYTAYMHEPYLDAAEGPDFRGVPSLPQEELDEFVCAADAEGFPIRIHAIGDATATMIIDAYEKAAKANGYKGLRHVIEHTDNLKAEDIVRMNRLGVSAAIQPQHPIGGFGQGMYELALGEERMANMWRYREEVDGGVHLGLGTDWPAVMSLDPVDTIYAAVTRSEFSGEPAEGYFRNNALTLGEALQAHTRGSAYVENFENRVGTLEAGKLADIIVLDCNPFEMDIMDLRSMNVELTMFNGKIVYQR